ncbi:ABC transporter permease [uncultured Sphaerochaeta sp.]|uniref:ABC transporter permease n=1 Tax=uncultured Sphaerochaeta sp. TaxID=886478 RepID=UPI002A0A94E0|nr:ABC transporter permease [uncultured Sphaerochaeta sp.]
MPNKLFNTIRPTIAILLGLLLAFILILFVSDTPITAMNYFLFGPLTNTRYLGNVLELTIPLIFSGLGTAILFRANQFNLGAEGIFYFSGLMSAIVAIKAPITSPILLPLLCIIVGMLVGMAISFIPGILKAKLGANELVSSLMLNSILIGVGSYIMNNTIRDKNLTDVASVKFPQAARLATIVPHTRIHTGLILALAISLALYLFFKHHKWGYLIRMFGMNKSYLSLAGYSAPAVIILVHIIGGAISGIGGSVEVLGMYSRFRWATLPGLGFDGAMVAMLAKNKPIPVIFSALFIAYIRTGADIMARQSDVTAEMVYIVQAVMILLISADKFLYHLEQKQLMKKAGV